MPDLGWYLPKIKCKYLVSRTGTMQLNLCLKRWLWIVNLISYKCCQNINNTKYLVSIYSCWFYLHHAYSNFWYIHLLVEINATNLLTSNIINFCPVKGGIFGRKGLDNCSLQIFPYWTWFLNSKIFIAIM
jgi:hypothetical protein